LSDSSASNPRRNKRSTSIKIPIIGIYFMISIHLSFIYYTHISHKDKYFYDTNAKIYIITK